MRKVELRMNEQLKYETIKELVDHHGNKRRAALKLNLSIRQVNRLINVYKAKGKAGFVHGNRNRRPANSLPQELAKQIIALYRNDYQGFNFKHFTEKLNEVECIAVSYKTVYSLLTSEGFYPPKEHKATKKRRAKARILANKPSICNEDLKIVKTKPRKRYIPPMTHPWKAASFRQQQRAHQYGQYA